MSPCILSVTASGPRLQASVCYLFLTIRVALRMARFLVLFCWTSDPNSFMYWGQVCLPAISSLSSIFYVILENGFILIFLFFYFKVPHLIHLHYWILFEQRMCLYNIVESQIKHGFQSDDHNFCSILLLLAPLWLGEVVVTSQTSLLIWNGKIICLLHRGWWGWHEISWI